MKKNRSHDSKNIEFWFQAESGKEIFIAGSFNNWNPARTKLKDTGDGLYKVTIHLSHGTHEYKFVMDDIWLIDPKNPETVENAFGSMNSVVTL